MSEVPLHRTKSVFLPLQCTTMHLKPSHFPSHPSSCQIQASVLTHAVLSYMRTSPHPAIIRPPPSPAHTQIKRRLPWEHSPVSKGTSLIRKRLTLRPCRRPVI